MHIAGDTSYVKVPQEFSLGKCLKQTLFSQNSMLKIVRVNDYLLNVLYISEEVAHSGCALTLHAISQKSPDILRRHATLAMPIAFFAMHEKTGTNIRYNCHAF